MSVEQLNRHEMQNMIKTFPYHPFSNQYAYLTPLIPAKTPLFQATVTCANFYLYEQEAHNLMNLEISSHLRFYAHGL